MKYKILNLKYDEWYMMKLKSYFLFSCFLLFFLNILKLLYNINFYNKILFYKISKINIILKWVILNY